MKVNAPYFSSLLPKLIITTCLLSLSSTVFAAQNPKPERWFEIEVILFKQLGDKKTLKEQFSADISAQNLPHYKRSFDLLTPYLQPDLTSIKQFMPLCNNIDGQSRFSLAQKQRVIALPEQTAFLQQAKAFTYVPIELAFTVETEKVDIQSPQNPVNIEKTPSKTNTEFVFDWQTESLNSPLFSTNKLCVYSRSDFKDIIDTEQLANVDLDGFAVTALPKYLNAPGSHKKNSPYLMSDEALLLTDISQRLGWSKEFSPLLHFGWRQVGITRKKATPLKLYAGEHVENDYQQAIKDYQIAVKEAHKQGQTMVKNLQPWTEADTNVAITNELDMRDYRADIKQQSLMQLFTDIKNIDSSSTQGLIVDETIKQLAPFTLDDLLASEKNAMDIEQPLNIANPPAKPLQPWFLHGFFKVHLDRYLYITADFNMLSQSLTGSDEAVMKLINFSQNRRVITGEIHYFDHPYIGMIVQIRRFDPTKPANEAVSQAIK